jgi:hypothetical protein
VEEVSGKPWLVSSRDERCTKRGDIIPPEMSVVPVPNRTRVPRAPGLSPARLRARAAYLAIREGNALGSERCSITSQSRAPRILLRCPAGKSAKSVRSCTTARRWSGRAQPPTRSQCSPENITVRPSMRARSRAARHSSTSVRGLTDTRPYNRPFCLRTAVSILTGSPAVSAKLGCQVMDRKASTKAIINQQRTEKSSNQRHGPFPRSSRQF